MPKQPNLLFLFTDEQRADTMACYGNESIHTPNLNALADRSVVFENAYVTQSVCTPSRSTIMTGLYPHTNGCVANNIPLKTDTPTIAEMVSSNYKRGYFGKWHLGDEVVPQHGFEEWVSIEDMYRGCYSREEYRERLSDYHHYLVKQGYEPTKQAQGALTFSRGVVANYPEPHTKAAFLGREAARFIRDNKDRPYMLYVNFLEPHMPFSGPLNDMYDPATLPVGPQFAEEVPGNTSWRNRIMSARWRKEAEGSASASTAEELWRLTRARYWGLCTMVDNAVGVILQALQESGQADNTIVVYTSDHGDMMGDHSMIAKCVQYEEAVKVPLLMRVPWLSHGHRIPGNISQVDLVPTLLELLGQAQPEGLDGESKAAVVRGEAGLDDNDVVIEWNGRNGVSAKESLMGLPPEDVMARMSLPWRTIVSPDRWKLSLCPDDQCELYDLNRDPHERDNRFDDPDQAARIRDLASRIREWQKDTGDHAPLPTV